MDHGTARPGELGQAVVGIVVVDSGGCNQLVLDENGGRNLPLVEDIEAHADQVVAVAFGEERDRTDQAGVWFAQFCATFGGGVLSHDGAVFRSSRFLKCAQGSERARIVNRADQNLLSARGTKVATDRLKTWT